MRPKNAPSHGPWLPISTAPVNGTVLLVRTREGYHLAHYVPGEPKGWIEQSGGYLLTETTTGLPTHWMSLPSLPSSE